MKCFIDNSVVKMGLLILLASGFLHAASINSAIAAELTFPNISTQGVGRVTAQPDQAEVRVSVHVTKKSPKEAKDWVDKVIVSLIDGLKPIGIAKAQLHSANLSLQPEYRYQNNQAPELLGYQASRSISIKGIPLSLLDKVLDTSVMKGAVRVEGIELKSSNEIELRAQARKAAIEDAKQKAKSLALGFDAELGKIWQIQYQQGNVGRPLMMKMEASASFYVAESYQNGQISFEDRVQVIYRLK